MILPLLESVFQGLIRSFNFKKREFKISIPEKGESLHGKVWFLRNHPKSLKTRPNCLVFPGGRVNKNLPAMQWTWVHPWPGKSPRVEE